MPNANPSPKLVSLVLVYIICIYSCYALRFVLHDLALLTRANNCRSVLSVAVTSVTSLSLVRKTIKLASTAEEGYELQAEFDEDIYAQRAQCSNNSLPASLQRCCTNANDTNCWQAGPNSQCIDGDLDISASVNQTTTGKAGGGLLLSARVSNIHTCDSVLFMTEALVRYIILARAYLYLRSSYLLGGRSDDFGFADGSRAHRRQR